MRVLLIYPPITVHVDEGVLPLPPLGLAYIAAVLEQNNHEVKILDSLALGFNTVKAHGNFKRIGLNEEEIRKYIEQFKPDIVGISALFSSQATNAHNVAGLAKEVCPEIPVVLGGVYSSIAPDAVLNDKNIDIVVRGEGELTLLELVRNLEKREDISEIAGIAVKKGNEIILNPARPLIQNLDNLSFPARHLLPMEIYFREMSQRYSMRHPVAHMITSRGCMLNCTFCSSSEVWGHKWRARSAKNVVDEIGYLVKNYGAREIQFHDDNISLDKKRITEICNEILKRGIDVKWTPSNGVALWTLDKPLLELMKKSGCYRLSFGIESGNLQTQKFIGKSLAPNKVKEVIGYANRIGLWTTSFYIIGFPYEPLNSIEDTINHAINSDVDFALFHLLRAFPGTRVYDIFQKEKLLQVDPMQPFSAPDLCDTKFFKREELLQWQNTAYSRFAARRLRSFLNPIRVLRKIHNFEDMRYALKLLKAAIKVRWSQRRVYGKVSLSQVLQE